MQRNLAMKLSYACALLIGVGFVAWMIPFSQIVPSHPLDMAFVGDAAQSVIGQRYFLGEPWHWPLLRSDRLDWPGGLSIAFTDSIPLLMLPLKLARPLLPPGYFVQDGWIALAWAVQPVAAVFALRSAGERRLLPAIAVAALSLCMPSLLRRLGQMSLCTHAILLVALGLYFRLNRDTRTRDGVAAIALLCAALLVHPYLLVMAAGLLAAAPLSLLLRRDRRWRTCTAWVGAASGAAVALGVLLGYFGSGVAGGYGIYSMNLLGPFVPGENAAIPFSIPDPTGGQAFEGFQYLGAGVLLLALAAAAGDRQALRLRAHRGLLLAMLGLTVFALSGTIYLGAWRLTHMQDWPNMVLQFRATGRFFWPVSYVILIGSVAAIGRAWPRFGTALLAAAVALQLADTRRMLLMDRSRAAAVGTWPIDVPALAPILARHDLLTIWPTDGCGAETGPGGVFMPLLLLGSTTLIRTNTMYAARSDPKQVCDPQATLGQPWQPGELRVILPPGRAADRRFVPDADRSCWPMPPMILCEQTPLVTAQWPADPGPILPLGQALEHGLPLLQAALDIGWGRDEPKGIWSLGSEAALRFQLPETRAPVRLTVDAYGQAPARGGTQAVHVLANGRPVAVWLVPDYLPATMQAVLPAGTTEIRFHIDHPTRPLDRFRLPDIRLLGLFLMRLRFDPA